MTEDVLDNPNYYLEPNKIPDDTKSVYFKYLDSKRRVVDPMRPQMEASLKGYRGMFTQLPGLISNTVVPLIFSHVEILTPSLSALPNPTVWPRENSEEERQRARLYRLLLPYFWEISRLHLKQIELVKSGEIYGTVFGRTRYDRIKTKRQVPVRKESIISSLFGGFLPGLPSKQTYWDYEERTVLEKDNPEVDIKELDNVFPDPDATSIDSSEWMIDRTSRLSFHDLSNMLDFRDKPKARSEVLKKLRKKMKEGHNLLASSDISDIVKDKLRYHNREMSPNPYKKQFTYIELENRYWVIGIILECLDLPPIVKHPNPIGTSTFFRFTPYIQPNEMYGIGVPEILWHLNVSANTLNQATLDNIILTVHKLYTLLGTSSLNEDQIIGKAGRVLKVVNHGELKPVPRDTVDFAGFRHLNELFRFSQNASSATDTLAGLRTQLTGGTATEASLLMQASTSRTNLMYSVLSLQAFWRIARTYIRFIELYAKETIPFKAMGEDGLTPEIQYATPEELVSKTGSELDVSIAFEPHSPEVRQTRLDRAGIILQSLAGLGMPPTHPAVESALMMLFEGTKFNDNPEQLLQRGREVIQENFNKLANEKPSGAPTGEVDVNVVS